MIQIDQDPLGRQARIVRRTDEELVMVKALEDGSAAAGLFNLGQHDREIAVALSELGLARRCAVRDLWRQKDVGTAEGRYSASIGRHGVALVRLQPAR
ncbi:MAG: hypothetical protein HUU20_09315 [Pirellulales bacterium]|nr:hypothetical protein [Pirellulales bacterium]